MYKKCFNFFLYNFYKKKNYFFLNGLQRTKTNYISKVLKRNKLYNLSDFFLDRHKPGHKHFRIYNDKNYIITDDYKNTIIIETIEKYNSILKIKHDTKHLVIFREPSRWLQSIYNWSLTNGWHKETNSYNDDIIISLLKEYFEYYLKFKTLENKNIYFLNSDSFEEEIDELSVFFEKKIFFYEEKKYLSPKYKYKKKINSKKLVNDFLKNNTKYIDFYNFIFKENKL